MSKELYFLCQPKEFKTGIKIYPPTVNDVVANEHFGQYVALLTYTQEDIEDEFVKAGKKLEAYPTPIEFMLNNSYHNKQYDELCKGAFKFFIHEEVTFLYEQKIVVIGNIQEVLKTAKTMEDLTIITEEEYLAMKS